MTIYSYLYSQDEIKASQSNGYLKDEKLDRSKVKASTSAGHLDDSVKDSSSSWVEGRAEQKVDENKELAQNSINDGKFSLLQFALYNFRDVIDK